jgi:hypothetical protein
MYIQLILASKWLERLGPIRRNNSTNSDENILAKKQGLHECGSVSLYLS